MASSTQLWCEFFVEMSVCQNESRDIDLEQIVEAPSAQQRGIFDLNGSAPHRLTLAQAPPRGVTYQAPELAGDWYATCVVSAGSYATCVVSLQARLRLHQGDGTEPRHIIGLV